MTKIECEVAGSIAVRAPSDVTDRLRRELSFAHPEYVRALRSSRGVAGIPERLHATVEFPEGILVPRGAVEVLRRVLAERGYEPEWRDNRALGTELRTGDYSGPELRDYQDEAARAAQQKLQGTIVLPPGGGKTTVGAELIGRIGRTALVVVHTEELLEQWCETIRVRLGIEPGRMLRGQSRIRSVTIAIVDTLDDVLAAVPNFGRCWGTVVVDECHFAPAATFQRVLMRLPARYRVGLTATPDREDGLGSLVDWSFGPRLVERDARELVRRGFLTAPAVRRVVTEFEFDAEKVSEKRRMAALQAALVSDEKRNRIIVSVVTEEAGKGEQVLVLSNSVEHCRSLAELMNGTHHGVVTGKSPKKERRETVEAFRNGKIPVLLATSLADHGVDWPRLSRVVLALPGSSRGRTIQRLGRLMRNYPGKKPVLVDVVDDRVPTLVRRWQERRRVYKKIDLEIEES